MRVLLWILFFLVTHCACFFCGKYWAGRESRRVCLIVNGEFAFKKDLDVLLAQYREDALKMLATQMVVKQSADFMKVSLSKQDEVAIKAIKSLDPEILEGRQRLLATQLLFRKIVLLDTSEDERKRIFDLFHKELTRYKISCVLLAPSYDATRLAAEMNAPNAKFETLARDFGNAGTLVPGEPLPSKWFNLTQLEVAFKQNNVEKVTAFPIGKIAGPIPSSEGDLLVRMDAKKESYSELRDEIDELIYNGRRNLYTYALGIDAAVTSPLIRDASAKKIKTATLQPKPSPKINGIVPTPTTLPDVQAGNITVGPAIPKPDASAVPLLPGLQPPPATPGPPIPGFRIVPGNPEPVPDVTTPLEQLFKTPQPK